MTITKITNFSKFSTPLCGSKNVYKAIMKRCKSLKTGGIYLTQTVFSRRLGWKDHEIYAVTSAQIHAALSLIC